VKRIVFLGDSITYDGRYVVDFEAWLRTRYPERPFEIINLGLPSETVSGLSEEGHAQGKFARPVLFDRLSSILEKTKPDLIFACYGINCGIYKPFDEDRFARYRDGIAKLHDAAVKAGARIVHVTPPMYDAKNAAEHTADYNGVLGKYSEWLLAKRAEGWEVADLHGPMTAEFDRRRASDPGFAFAADGVHPDDAGHWFIARQLIAYCGDAKAASAIAPEDALDHKAEAIPLLHDRMVLMRDAWLTATGHNHPMVPAGMKLEDIPNATADLDREIDDALCDC
jgi:lysophospholipase L1-like esterase